MDAERHELLAQLRLARLGGDEPTNGGLPVLLGQPATPCVPATPDEKIDLFLRLFRCREDVFPKRWENSKTGNRGYSPACRLEWVKGTCEKPRIKCSECPNKSFPSLDREAVRSHLYGRHTIGTYAIREDDTTTFLAVDFDGPSWRPDVSAFRRASLEFGVQAAVERSRSGEGAHAWIFFAGPLSAALARRLGTVIMARAIANRHSMGLAGFDRFFPNQDTLRKGGFGNLIALPFQKGPKRRGFTMFLDEDLEPFKSQWSALAQMRLLSPNEVESVVGRSVRPLIRTQFEWQDVRTAESALDVGIVPILKEPWDGVVTFEIDSQLRIPLEGLPSSLISAFKRLASFANPKFFELQRQRFSTYKTPRYIFCGELDGGKLVLPRGLLGECARLCREAGAKFSVTDDRANLPTLPITFFGELSRAQARALAAALEESDGVVVAPPGAGKTVIACAAIARRQVATLVLVNRKPLMDQWRERIHQFLAIPKKQIGTYGAGRKKLTGQVDVAMMQSLVKSPDMVEILANYGHVVVDECHHIPAISFETLVKASPARYFLGLTATPYRKDGLQSIIHMQCGPIRHTITSADSYQLAKLVRVRESPFTLPEGTPAQLPYSEFVRYLSLDEARIQLVASDIAEVVRHGHFPLVLSDRVKHLALLKEAIGKQLRDTTHASFWLTGGGGAKQRATVLGEIESCLEARQGGYILATASLVGEGFDLAGLDTLFLTMPISHKGRLVQYAGRIERTVEGKEQVTVYDYLDSNCAMTMKMFKGRLRAYKEMGYAVVDDEAMRKSQWVRQLGLRL